MGLELGGGLLKAQRQKPPKCSPEEDTKVKSSLQDLVDAVRGLEAHSKGLM